MHRSLGEQAAPPPPPPPPPPLPAPRFTLKAALELAGPGDQEDVREVLRRRKASFSEHFTWLLFNNPMPSLIQEGPQCGLVALWMAGARLHLPVAVSLERIMQVALERGYTAQGEMFSAADMAKLAEEVFPCQTELLSGGLEGRNHERILQHLMAGLPVLIPYDEDSNHEPCLRSGYKAHWAVASGALLGLKRDLQLPDHKEDKEIPGLFHAGPALSALPLEAVAETYLLAKQGKSGRSQLWSYSQLQQSNAQLTDFSPKRAADGKVYIVPAGGVQEGLCGKAVLLWPAVPGGGPASAEPVLSQGQLSHKHCGLLKAAGYTPGGGCGSSARKTASSSLEAVSGEPQPKRPLLGQSAEQEPRWF